MIKDLDKNKKYLLACSFGPDSMALFDMLIKNGYSFEVAHVNYKLREEADQETKSLEKYCELNNIKFHKFVNNMPMLNGNLEAKCRMIRYNFFKSIYSGFDALLVAHNQDDHLETFYLQKNRNSRVNYFGIAEKSYSFDMEVIRPLLNYKKAELLDYCIKNNVPYAIDKTNLENNFMRNRIRHNLIEHFSDEDRKNALEDIENSNTELRIIKEKLSGVDLNSCDELLKLDLDEFCYAITELARRVDKSLSLSEKCCEEIRKILESNKPNVTFEINLFLTFVKEYNSVKFVNKNETQNYCYTIEKPSELDTPFFKLDFTDGAEDRNIFKDSYPIKIRNALPDDRYQIKEYVKTVRRLFIDWKMPLSLRKRWPVIEDKTGKIVYIPRYRNDFIVTKKLNFVVK